MSARQDEFVRVETSLRHGRPGVGAPTREAARRIEEHGWCQGRATGRGLCAWAAVKFTVPSAAFDTTISALESRIGMNLITWNDAPGRTKAEVLELLR